MGCCDETEAQRGPIWYFALATVSLDTTRPTLSFLTLNSWKVLARKVMDKALG